MACGLYEEVSNGLKMSLVGAAIGALAWFILGTGAKESYAKRRHEREMEEKQAEREREKREHEKQMIELRKRQAGVANIGSAILEGWN